MATGASLDGKTIKNTSIKRIRADIRELALDPSDEYHASPLEDNLFDWHFTIRGPKNTEFDGGVYHGRIILPPDYPFKPPNIVLLTPNGRWEIKKKICLSISAYHPEEWQPAWGIRLILEALISFMTTKGEGAVGALDYGPEERQRLARESLKWRCAKCGDPVELLPKVQEDASRGRTKNRYAEQIKEMHMHSLENESSAQPSTHTPAPAGEETQNAKSESEPAAGQNTDAIAEARSETQDEGLRLRVRQQPETPPTNVAETRVTEEAGPVRPSDGEAVAQSQATANQSREDEDKSDRLLTYIILSVSCLLFALIVRKLIRSWSDNN